VELVRHRTNGLLVPPRSVDAMAEALLEVTQLDRCRAMQAAAPQILQQWRTAADPVEGVRAALRHFRLI
jgi:glycosyltransferase involved in cell wall biosynthesis